MAKGFDFSGYATKNDLKCADGRTIRKDAFLHCDGLTVPLVYQHLHNDINNVLGHALLECRDDGVYAYGSFNDTMAGQNAKSQVQHGDITQLSIYANHLTQRGGDVYHGDIKEVSLVLAGANPGAVIDFPVLEHGEQMDDEDVEEAIIYTNEKFSLAHADDTDEKEDDGKTIQDVYEAMTDEQKAVVQFLVGKALEENSGSEDEDMSQSDDDEDYIEHSDYEEGDTMKYNVFDREEESRRDVLTHDDMQEIFASAKRLGSLKEAVNDYIEHSDYGIEDIDWLFPDARTITNTPDFIKRRTEWVADVLDGAHHSPFARIKSVQADITADEARAKGYTKGKKKMEEVFTLLKRSTEPCTIYKKQKLDRDDVIDITDFDVVAFVKGEMRLMYEEELARAALIGDGRLSSSDDKIPEDHIRPIWKDDDLYSMHYTITTDMSDTPTARAAKAELFIDEVVKAMADYEGSGTPKLFAPQDIITDCLLLKDTNKHRLYKTKEELATALGVSKIVPVPVMKNQTRVVDSTTRTLGAIIINMTDYTFGADKGGSLSTFEDFDIDYNQMKYLMEGRCSGAMRKVKSAVVMEFIPTTTGE